MKLDYLKLIANSKPFAGYYNKNYFCAIDSKEVVVRIPIENSDEMDFSIIPEDKILKFLEDYNLPVPKLLYLSKEPFYQVHEFIKGHVVNDKFPRGTVLPEVYIPQTVELIKNLWNIDEFPFKNYFVDWPKDGDTKGFFRKLCDKVNDIYSKDTAEYAGLYKTLGIPSEPLKEAFKLANSLKERKFVLCHSDIHRKNCIIDNDKVYYLDWELALFADPAYEIAVHLHKVTYTLEEEKRFRKLVDKILMFDKEDFWNDVSTYLKLEKVKSAIVDAIRYYKQINDENTPIELSNELTKKYSHKLLETKGIWNNEVLAPDEVYNILKNY